MQKELILLLPRAQVEGHYFLASLCYEKSQIEVIHPGEKGVICHVEIFSGIHLAV